jgi:hypothetical protein
MKTAERNKHIAIGHAEAEKFKKANPEYKHSIHGTHMLQQLVAHHLPITAANMAKVFASHPLRQNASNDAASEGGLKALARNNDEFESGARAFAEIAASLRKAPKKK